MIPIVGYNTNSAPAFQLVRKVFTVNLCAQKVPMKKCQHLITIAYYSCTCVCRAVQSKLAKTLDKRERIFSYGYLGKHNYEIKVERIQYCINCHHLLFINNCHYGRNYIFCLSVRPSRATDSYIHRTYMCTSRGSLLLIHMPFINSAQNVLWLLPIMYSKRWPSYRETVGHEIKSKHMLTIAIA